MTNPTVEQILVKPGRFVTEKRYYFDGGFAVWFVMIGFFLGLVFGMALALLGVA